MEDRKSLLYPSSCLQLIALYGLFPLLNDKLKIHSDQDMALILLLHTLWFVTVENALL